MKIYLIQGFLSILFVFAWWYEIKDRVWVPVPWYYVILLLLVISYLQQASKKRIGRMNYSLATAFCLAVMFNYGPLLAMTLNPLVHFFADLHKKNPLYRAYFNLLQMSLSAFVGGVVFRLLGGVVGAFTLPKDVLALILGALSYAVTNLLIVTYFVSVDQKVPWGKIVRDLTVWVHFGYFVALYTGVMYALVTLSYGIFGFIAFSILLVLFSRMLQFGVDYSMEKQKREDVEKELLLDPKTEVYNFQFLNAWLASLEDTPVSLLFLDIDDFKVINDQYGHDYGDEILRQVASLLKKNVGPLDHVVRYGGEEFVVLLHQKDSKEARATSEALRLCIARAFNPVVTASFGVASFPELSSDRRELIRRADAAMYKAKMRGKNQSYVWRKEKKG